ncbi:hypothetical protein A0J48_008960 [Sphaerospermopsis aphanizomenoides BCCUSP55]|uniref:hypothetical protein n=1 Tax=Sphaerospermopsis aphanizomenoides TaxID=459663 RepID=UPI001907CE45|nr:hypothetical protein [Sphaerospermopsis aphanizomenoides]MBK1987662.1 hypothetical protein [Sphaerospermopsis aphanizomenoides BCCUSP55]
MINKDHQNQDDYQNDPVVKRILARVPADIAATFTDSQLAELKKVFIDRANKSSSVDMRLSIPFFNRRFYLVLLMGKEKRSLQRLKKSTFKVINSFVGTTYILAMISIILFGSIYLIEEKLRIDSFLPKQIEKVRDSFN